MSNGAHVVARRTDHSRLITTTTSELLAADGDPRQTLDAAGRNRYGNEYCPDDGLLAYGSCTSSTVSRTGYMAAQEIQHWMGSIEQNFLDRAVEDLYDKIRREISWVLCPESSSRADVVITPSGTDAEFIPALIALESGRDLANIVVGASEAGSGTYLAASCRHFADLAPSGRSVDVGEPVDDAIAERIETFNIAIRRPDASPRSEEEIDSEVESLVADNLARGRNVLLHVIAHSKTGVHAPSLTVAGRLADAHPDRVHVVIDAAQGRFSRRGLEQSLERGFMAIITGSKFFGGPAFVGAVLLPHRSIPPLAAVPSGFADYFCASMFPHSWVGVRATMSPQPNLGVVIRWWSALAGITEYYAVPARLRLEVLRHFERVVPHVLGASEFLVLDPISPPMLENDLERLLESKMTVFPFSCVTADGAPVSFDDLARIRTCMRDDLDSDSDSGSAAVIASLSSLPRVEMGQPVRLGSVSDERAVLRLAVGARQIVDVCRFDASGDSFNDRLLGITSEVEAIVTKLDAILRHQLYRRSEPETVR